MGDAIAFPSGTSAMMISGNNEIWLYPPGKGPQKGPVTVTECDLGHSPWPDAEEIEACREALCAGEPVIFRFSTSHEAAAAYSRICWLCRPWPSRFDAEN